jgi:3-methylfumaryl-CoA hydratase
MQQMTQPLEQWVGRTKTVTDVISPVQARQMAATLDDAARMKQPELATLPVGWHWLYFNPMEVQSQLGDDGHPLRGDFLPPVQLPRRMWAGSRLKWTRAFNVGSTVEKNSEILKITRKTGRSGEMVFVTVAHRYSDAQGLLLNEEHDIVYCDNPSDAGKAAVADVAAKIRAACDFPEIVFERKGEHTKPVHVDSIMLYRYSAATFNGHRIHYDVDYCRDVEGYPGLVVHGPLIATLLLGYVENEIAAGRFIRAFEFRANRPTFDTSDFHLHASKTEENNTWRFCRDNVEGTNDPALGVENQKARL